MLNPSQNLNPKIFDKDVEQVPIRKGFGEGLVKAAEADKRIVGLCADLTESTHMLAFKQKFPERFVEMGIAEQNLAALASGMAAMGKIPFITSYAMFSPGRNWEQIRTTICYNKDRADLCRVVGGLVQQWPVIGSKTTGKNAQNKSRGHYQRIHNDHVPKI